MNEEQRKKTRQVQRVSNVHRNLVEKDFLLDAVIETVANIKIDNCHLVFGGGTSLSKCFCVTRRMSEDIDFKFAVNPYLPAKRTISRPYLG